MKKRKPLAKVILLSLFLAVFAINATAQKVTLSFQNETFEKVLNSIKQQTGLSPVYSEQIVDLNRKVSINVNSVEVDEALTLLLKDTNIEYEIKNNKLYLIEKKQTKETEKSGSPKKITGLITDANGEPIIGASILVKGQNAGAITDNDGKFSLEVKIKDLLKISYIGYISEEVIVDNRINYKVKLDEDTKTLDEIVVVGYGSMKRSDLTGSVSSVNAQQLSSFPTAGAVEALQGRASGVQITSNNGEPGGSMTVKIRGGSSINASSTPLYVVDGFPGAFLPQPEDIESMEILKDASSTAIYGSRGANGVIMITTKKGSKGNKRIEYNASYSEQSITKRIDLMNAQEFLDFNKTFYPTYVSDGFDTDWQDVIFQKGNVQTHQISLSGGSDNANYYVSGSYYNQDGLIIGSGYEKMSITSNVNLKVNEKFNVGVNLFAQRTGQDGVLTQESSGGAAQAGVIGSALRFMPDQGIYKPDGVTYSLAKLGDPIDNPYTVLHENTRNVISDRFQTNLSGEYFILKNLSFKSTFGITTKNDRTGTYASSLTSLAAGKGNASMSASKNTSIVSEDYFNFNQTFAENHKINVMAGYSYANDWDENWGATSNAFITDAFTYWNMGAGTVTPSIATSKLISEQLTSFYGRLNYSFSNRYLLTVTSRYDGSSKFSKNHKWAFFPSGSFAWNMHNENFMQNQKLISQWKWRASYGVVGNQAINSYQTLARLTPVLSIVNGVPVTAVLPSAVANDNLKWESTASANIGIDIGFLKNRISLTVDAYRNVTKDLLFSVNLPPYSGIFNQIQNVGKLENKGLEFSVNSKNITGKFEWNTDFNISFNKNKILELPNHKDILYGNNPGHWPGFANARIMREGEPLGSFYGYTYDGVYQTGDTFIPGAGFEQMVGGEKYKDVDGMGTDGKLTGQPDNILNTNDQKIIGNPNPDFFFGFNNEFKYKGFDLTIFINGSQGNDIYSYQLQELENLGSYGYNATREVLKSWSPTNTNTNVPIKNLSRSLKPSSRWVMDGSYIRIKNIMFGYNLPKNIIQKLQIQKLRVYVSAQNLFTITDYRGFDPEVNYRTSNTNQGTDYASYPMAKSITVGLNVAF
ncbi:MAG: TonB-dependent receptor [Paludibacter sp.]|nr:TonB-dependent receptor [Paludibacter sp.]